MIEKFKSKIEKFIPLRDDVWNEIKQGLEPLHVKKNEVLIHYAELQKYVYFVASGSFEISLINTNGSSKTVWFFLDEMFDMAVCLDSFYLNEPTKYEITALEDSEVVKINQRLIENWSEDYPLLAKFFMHDVLGHFVHTTEIRNYMISHSPVEFINHLKKNYPYILERIPSKNLAHFMGITPEWYSKLKKKLTT